MYAAWAQVCCVAHGFCGSGGRKGSLQRFWIYINIQATTEQRSFLSQHEPFHAPHIVFGFALLMHFYVFTRAYTRANGLHLYSVWPYNVWPPALTYHKLQNRIIPTSMIQTDSEHLFLFPPQTDSEPCCRWDSGSIFLRKDKEGENTCTTPRSCANCILIQQVVALLNTFNLLW